MYNQIVTSNNSKNIILPFNGLYQSILGTELDSSIEYEIDNSESASDNIEKINDLIYDNLDIKGFNRKLCAIYADTLAEVINFEFDTKLHFSSVDYIGLNGQNVGDNVVCNVDVDCLPSIKDIAELLQTSVTDVWVKLQELGNEQFSSYSGFISFYDTDLTVLHNADYASWGEGYIMLIIQLLLNEAGKDTGDIEQQTIENINNDYGSVLELAYSYISDDSVINELNKLFDY